MNHWNSPKKAIELQALRDSVADAAGVGAVKTSATAP
jgi:hypothetical protein